MKRELLIAMAVLACSSPALAALHEIAIATEDVSSVTFDGRQLHSTTIAIPGVGEPGAILSCLLELRLQPAPGDDGASEVQAAALRDGAVVIPEGKIGPVAAYAFGETEAILQLDITPILRQSLAEGRSQEAILVGRIDADALGRPIVVSLDAGAEIWGRLILHLREM